MENFHFLSAEFFKIRDTRQFTDFWMESSAIHLMFDMEQTAEEYAHSRGKNLSLLTLKTFVNHMISFFYLFVDEEQKKIHEAFAKATSEEWFFVILEGYLLHSKSGRYDLVQLLKDGLFEDKVQALYNSTNTSSKKYGEPSKYFLNPNYKVAETVFSKRLDTLFNLLEMPRVTKRNGFEVFQKNFFKGFKEILDINSYKHMKNTMKKYAEKEEWTGNWYIFDLKLFVEAIQTAYQKSLNLHFNHIAPSSDSDSDSEENFPILNKEEEEAHANSAFVGVLVDLVHGHLKEWSQLSQIPFKDIYLSIKSISYQKK